MEVDDELVRRLKGASKSERKAWDSENFTHQQWRGLAREVADLVDALPDPPPKLPCCAYCGVEMTHIHGTMGHYLKCRNVECKVQPCTIVQPTIHDAIAAATPKHLAPAPEPAKEYYARGRIGPFDWAARWAQSEGITTPVIGLAKRFPAPHAYGFPPDRWEFIPCDVVDGATVSVILTNDAVNLASRSHLPKGGEG